jgi:hypothetical protein
VAALVVPAAAVEQPQPVVVAAAEEEESSWRNDGPSSQERDIPSSSALGVRAVPKTRRERMVG